MTIEISETLAQLRQQMGLTQEEAASHLGITKAAVSKWECGQSLPDISLLPAIASLYSTTIDDLLGCTQELDSATINEIYQNALTLLKEKYETGLEYVLMQARKNWNHPELLRLLGASLFAQIPALPGFDEEMLESDSLLCAQETERIIRRAMQISSEETAYLTELPALTRILMWTGRRSEAEELLNGQVKNEPNLQAELLAQLYNEDGRKEEGIAVLQRALLISVLETQTAMASMTSLIDDEQLSDLAEFAKSIQSNAEFISLFPTLMPTIRLQQAKNFSNAKLLEDALIALELFTGELDKATEVISNPINPRIFDKVQDMMWADTDASTSKVRSEAAATLREAYALSLATDDVWIPLRDNARFQNIVSRIS